MRPSFLDNMSWAMAEVYGAVTDRILINLATYFPYSDNAPRDIKDMFAYQARMLAQLGQVNRETADIIAGSLDGEFAALRQALEAAILDALKNEEPKLRKAAEKGLLQGGGLLPPEVQPNQLQAFAAYYQQSADKLNLVNTVMLESTQAAYTAAVTDVAARIGRTQSILNVGAGEVITGVSSWNTAMHDAVKKMVENGLTGFVDHAGHRWSPEAYVAMDIRTTMFNTSRAAVWERANSYGADLYQVSSHNGARPLCYPWQGKVISRSGWTGEVEDLDGNRVQVHSQSEIESFNYGGGLFGVNCRHYPMTFIPGFSTLKGQPQGPEENAEAYALSQQQRGLERRLRYEKRDLAVMQAQGAPVDALRAQRERVNGASNALQDFCDENGLPRRRSREYTPVNAKFPPGDSYDPTQFPTEQRDRMQAFFGGGTVSVETAPQPVEHAFTPAKTIEEAILRMEADGVKYARLQSMSLEYANNTLEAVETLPIDARPTVIANGKETSLLTGRPMGRKSDQWYGVTYDYRAFDFSVQKLGYAPDYSGGICVGLNTSKYKTLESITSAKISEQQKYIQKTGREWFFNTEGRATAFHEMGHVYYDVKGAPDGWEMIAEKWANDSNCDMLKSPSEAFAEAWAAYHTMGRELPSYIKTIIEGLK